MERKAKWYFDTRAGRDEVLRRRIGTNELDAIAICRGFVEAQKEYAQEKHDDSKVNQYAQRIISTPGKQDGRAIINTPQRAVAAAQPREAQAFYVATPHGFEP